MTRETQEDDVDHAELRDDEQADESTHARRIADQLRMLDEDDEE